jgi:dihydrolipoamide dehydrogenase
LHHDLVVLGAGPGGYVAAIRAAQLGMNVGLVEKEAELGGTCLRIGCIPSKALLDSSERFAQARHSLAEHGIKVGRVGLDLAAMLRRKEQVVKGLVTGVDALMRKNKVTRHRGHGRLAGFVEGAGAPGGERGAVKVIVEGPGGASELTATRVLLATGSKVARLPGVELDLDRVATSTEALSWPEVPRRLIVIGAGAIGLELGSVWSRLGAEVLVLELLERILPGVDGEIAAEARKLLERQGLQFRLGTRVKRAARGAKFPYEAVVELDGGETLQADRVLLAVGRVPNTDGLGLESVGVEPDAKGRIPVGERFETRSPNVFAIGDVIRGPMLAHKAEEEGIACVEAIATGHGHVDYDAIPSIVYLEPEVASVGKCEEELREAGVPYRRGVFQFRGNGRARAAATIDGRVKILAHRESDRILGVHVLGPHASELIAEAAAAITFHASAEDLARTCHAHPTLAEAMKEAALAVDGRAIHA